MECGKKQYMAATETDGETERKTGVWSNVRRESFSGKQARLKPNENQTTNSVLVRGENIRG